MSKDNFPESRMMTGRQFLQAYQVGLKNKERFCFVLGSGASVESGIPMGGTLENHWMACIMGEKDDIDGTPAFDPDDTRRLAGALHTEGKLQYEFEEIENAWAEIKKAGKGTLSSEYYFDLFKIRFFPNHRNGHYYLERIMADKEPSFGYHPLAHMLTDKGGNNLAITTNFDSLIEDALFLYTRSKPLVINHELLADYIGNNNLQRPIIAKVHRGMFFDPLNATEDTTGLKGRWREVLEHAFQIYTPIVIGYGGGDHSLMDFLTKARMQNGIYWCYVEEYGLPDQRIQKLVLNNNGCFVRTQGFDSLMLMIGNKFYPDKINTHATEQYLSARNSERIERYQKTVDALTGLGTETAPDEDEDFQRELEQFKRREEEGRQEREEKQQMTAWDYNRKAYRAYHEKQYKEALQYCIEAIKLQPENAVFYNNRGIIYGEMGEREKALTDYTKALELDSLNVDVYNNRGTLYADMGEREKALRDYTKALELNSSDVDIYNNRGALYAEMGEREKALRDYAKALELDSSHVKAYNNRGILYAEMGEGEKALRDYTKALELDSSHVKAYNNRGNLYAEMGEREKALGDYTKALELDSSDAYVYSNRGELYAKMCEQEKALADFRKAIELNPLLVEPYQQLGEIYDSIGQYEQALEYYNEAIAIDDQCAESYQNRAKVFRALGRVEEAEADERRAGELAVRPKAEDSV